MPPPLRVALAAADSTAVHLGVAYCPVMRTRLSRGDGADACLHAEAGHGAGEAASLSAAAGAAKATHCAAELLAIDRRLEASARRGDTPVQAGS